MTEYDVIIAGAGPAGGECARYLADNSNLSVLVLDRTQEIGEPKKSTAGTFAETIKTFRLPKKVVMCRINKAVIEGPSEEAVFPVDGYVLEFGRLKKFLIESAVHNGAEVKIDATVAGPIIENNKIVGVRYSDLEGQHNASAKIVIDATGPAAVLATQLGLRSLNQKKHWIGMEFEMEKLNLKYQNAMLIKLDSGFTPGGYSWIFSTGKNHAKVGNCWNSAFFKKKGGSGSQLSYLKKWIRADGSLRNGIPLEIHGGDAYIDSVKKRSTNNFMSIGDSSCTIHPLFGEGIRPGMYSGMFAAQTAIEALKANNTSAKQLNRYDARWRAYARQWGVAMFVNLLLYNLPNSGLDKVIKCISKLDARVLQKFISFNTTLNDARKVISWR